MKLGSLPIALQRLARETNARHEVANAVRDAILAEREACARCAECFGAYNGNNADILIAKKIRERPQP